MQLGKLAFYETTAIARPFALPALGGAPIRFISLRRSPRHTRIYDTHHTNAAVLASFAECFPNICYK
jgi:hypothetical protein